MNLQEKIISALNSPQTLESIYREHPREFTKIFPEIFSTYPDSLILKVWSERLFFKSIASPDLIPDRNLWQLKDILFIFVLSLIAGILIKIPDFIHHIEPDFFYSRYLSFIVFMTLISYFLFQHHSSIKTMGTISGLFMSALIYMTLLPSDAQSQTLLLSCLHVPFFLWSLLGLAFVSGRYQDLSARMDYIRYNGEVLIFTTILLIGGMVLTGITFALFKLINLDVEEWYLSNIVVYGSIASPLVATFLIDKIIDTRLKIAPILAKTFTPLFFLTALVYLGAMIVQGKSPYLNRDFLIAFNMLLLIVLGLSVFNISERGSSQNNSVGDVINIALVAVTLMIDLVALSAILFRLSSYGFTPNRIAVLGVNLSIFCHLCGIILNYIRFFRGTAIFSSLEHWIVGYIPVYTVWTAIVIFGFPLFFRFK